MSHLGPRNVRRTHGRAGLLAPLSAAAAFALMSSPARAQQATPSSPGAAEPVVRITETLEVVATRIPEDAHAVPASITVVTGEELRDRGATDLRSALALVAGVDISPGSDFGGAAGSVPEIWGLREFDAYLLVVDGVPWGGAFNPAVATLSLTNVERIEVLRGAAPVMYGATSFSGVIHVVHRAPGAVGGVASLSAGSWSSGLGAVSVPLPQRGRLASTLDVDVTRRGARDDRTDWTRGHVLWRNGWSSTHGTWRFDLDATGLNQGPASPHPRQGPALSPLVPLDANHQPAGAFLRDRRLALTLGHDRGFAKGKWATLVSVASSEQRAFRGFLTDVSEDDPNANGFRETVRLTDVYFDSHVEWTPPSRVRIVAGIDALHGDGHARGGDFDYFIHLDGSDAPRSADLPPAAAIRLKDRRFFAGGYGFVQWDATEAWRFELGTRLNVTNESRSASTLELATGDLEAGDDSRSVRRLSGTAAVSFTPWRDGADDVRLFADYRDAYKPAAVDFGLDSSPEILDPETASSVELGVKCRVADAAVDLEVTAFRMDFENLVVSQAGSGGLPTLVNAGSERFEGIEAGVSWKVRQDLRLNASYSVHDARFQDYVTQFDGVPTQLAGKRLELSARMLASAGVVYAPAHGVVARLELGWVGDRYLNKRNTALAPGYNVVTAGIGYRTRQWEARLDVTNLTDERPPVSESEIGDAQYYRLPARALDVTVSRRF